MALDRSPIRETGSSDSNRPAPAGDYDGTTRAGTLKALLDKSEAAKEERPSLLKRFLKVRLSTAQGS